MKNVAGKLRFFGISLKTIFLVTILLCLFNQKSYSATYISNSAVADYTVGSLIKTTPSNLVKTQVCSRAKIELLKYAPLANSAEQLVVTKTYYHDPLSNEYELPSPVAVGSKVGLSIGSALPLVKSEIFHGGEPIFIKLSDDDHNVDPTKQDVIIVTLKVTDEKKKLVLDEETLKFYETDINSGVFVGFIQSSKESAVKYNGVLNVKEESKIQASYSDKCGPDDTGTAITVIQAVSLVDPFGKLFDSSNGTPINGVKVTLIDASTNLPATVFGDDGVSTYPSTVVTGGTATDSSGVVYVFPEGEYRFPLIPAGNYILKVEPPAGYKWPSIISDDKLSALPNGPFTITVGSRGEVFNVPVGSAPIKIDIPLDPMQTTALFVSKEASKEIVSIGDFLKYKITVENFSSFTVNSVKVKDTLPLGFRFRKGSVRLNGSSMGDPVISEDGRTLEFPVGNLPSNGKAEITYVVEVAVGAKLGPAKNIAMASGDGGATSNIAKAEVLVKDDFFQTKSFIIGKVAIGCNIKEPEPEKRIEKEVEVKTVELKGNLRAELISSLLERGDSYDINYSLAIEVGEVGVKNVRVSVIFPEGINYKAGSSKFGDRVLEPEVTEKALSYKLGDLPANFKGVLRFTGETTRNGKEGELSTKALVTFDTESENNLRCDILDTTCNRTTKTDATTIPPIVIRPKFESGSAILTDDDKLKLDDLIAQLRGYRIKSIEVIGHTDSQKIGKKIKNIYPDNYALSKARAESVVSYLMKFLDLSMATVKTVGKGEDEPVVPNTNPYNMSLNRRVEINIVAEKRTEFATVKPLKEKSQIVKKEFSVTLTERKEIVKEVVEKPSKKETNLPQFGDGISGVRIYMEDGTYVITDKNGMYHIEGVKPGTHVLQLDKKTIPEGYEVIFYEENTRFSETPYSQFVDVQGGTLWRADFYLCPKVEEKPKEKPVEVKAEKPKESPRILKGNLRAELISSLLERGDSYDINYSLAIEVGEVGVKNVRVSVIFPEGINYKAGSSKFGDRVLEPEVMEKTLSYRLGDLPANFKGVLRFTGETTRNGKEGELSTKALVTFDTESENNLRCDILDTTYNRTKKTDATTIPPIVIRPKFESGSAVLTSDDKLKLDDLISQLRGYRIKSIEVIGHTDSQKIGSKIKSIYPDNYALSKARAESVVSYLMKFLDLSMATVKTVGKGEDEPVFPNTNPYNMSLNRRVEINIVAEKVTEFATVKPLKEKSGVNEKTFTLTEKLTSKAVEKKAEVKQSRKKDEPKTIDDITQDWVERQFHGFEFILPKDGYYPNIPAINIAVKFNPSSKLKLFLNGKEVDGVFLDSTKKSSSLFASVTTWAGVHIIEGDNLLEAVEYDANGKELNRIKKIVHYSGPPVKVVLVPEKSQLVADGKTPPVIAVKLLDKDGHPAREGVLGECKVLPPHIPLKTAQDLQLDPLSKSSSEMSKYLVKEDGIAFIELNPTSQTGEAVLKFNLMSGEKELRVWLKPEKRDWILVGLAEGTLGFSSPSGNKGSFTASGMEDGFSRDGRVAFFAKGMLDDNWLLTLSYDSDRTGYKGNNKLFRTIDPAQYYTLYGDTSQQQYEAQSSKPLYVKLERERFYALFGDFQTGLTNTELSKYNRSLTGLKSELKADKYEFNIFLADTNQQFVRDELRGDGTSGLYSLSKKNIVINSEKVIIETRDRFKSEVILSTKTLSRFIDYSIDYDTGKIFFKSPVSSFDESLNPVYIVVEYEVFDYNQSAYNFGGRGALKLLDKKLELGLSYIHEGAIGKEGDLIGADLKVAITEKTTLKAEIASTNSNNSGVDLSGIAYLAELSHISDKLTGKIYYREQEKDFGFNQQNVSEGGTRKMGLSGRYSLTKSVDVSTELMRQYNLTDDTRRDLAELKTIYRDKSYDFFAGLRHAEDTLSNGDTKVSEQLLAGGAVRLLDDKLTLKVQRDQSVGGNKNADFPTRTMLGADYTLSEKITIFASHEMLDGKTVETDISRIGMKSTPWKGGLLNTSLEQQHTENGTRIFSVMGLKQDWQLNEKWSLSAGLDRSDTIKKPTYSLNGNTYSAGSDSDFTAVNFGAGFKEKLWGWNGRIEYRDGKDQDKAGLFTSIYGEVKEGIGLGSALQLFDTKSHTTEQIFADLRFGIVYRPKVTKWTLLDRFDLIFDSLRGGDNAYDSWRLINNFNANYKDGKKTQFSIQYAFKFVSERIDEKDYSGYTDMIGFEGRYDIKNNWDIGFRFRLLHSWSMGQYKYSFGPTVGYTPKKNIWLSVGYNLTGFTDRDFSKADYTAHGIFINFRIKFDQESVKNSIRWLIGSPAN